MPRTELVSRSCFSLLEGASQPEELVEEAARVGVSTLGLVDRDAVYGVVQAHKAAKAAGVRLLVGATLTVADHPPLHLLARTHAGWSTLCRLLTAARAGQPKGRARVELSRLLAETEGLLALLPPKWEVSAAARVAEAFGEHLALLASRTGRAGDASRLAETDALSARLGVPVVATSDVLFHQRERRPLADILACIRRRTTLSAAGTHLAQNDARFLESDLAFRYRWRDRPELVDQAEALAARCAFSLDELRYVYPREVVPDGERPMTWLRRLTEAGLAERYPDGPSPEVRQQVEHELGVIAELDFPSYFLTVADVVAFARRKGILCQGRGSAANSAVCYALGITAVDPSRTTLLFERFLSKERGEPPDIDIDFEHERREEVIQYVYQRYGRDRAALVNEFISYRGRSAVRDVGKVFGLSLDQVDRLARSLDRWAAGSSVPTDDLVREAGLDPVAPAVRHTLAYAELLRSFPRHLSIHVGGFVIAADQLIDLVPVEPASMKDRTVIQWDKYDVDDLQFVKVDLLGLGMLTCIRKSFDLIRSVGGPQLTLATVPSEDPLVYDLFCQADTVGVFQIESRAQMSMLPRLRPRCFYDLVVEVAIVRPGPIQGGMVHPYLRRRLGEEEVTYAHPLLEPILARTLGVPLFQEQVMAIAVAVGGFTPGEADQLRRAMGAWRKRGSLHAMGRRLVEGMIARGVASDYAEAIFAQILGFGEYGFPESHAASFALLVYVSGWLKRHHPAAFAGALLNSQPMGFYSPRAILADAQRHGVEVRPLSAQFSQWDNTLEGPADRPALRVGLRMVAGLAEAEAQALVAARQEGPFHSLAELARRSGLSRGSLQRLAAARAFEDLGAGRRQAAWQIQGLWTELPLFAGLNRREPEARLPEESAEQRLQADYRATGFAIDAHPVGLMRSRLDRLGCLSAAALLQRRDRERVRLAGLVSSRQRPETAAGVVFMTLEDETGLANLVIWPKVWAEHRKLAREATLLGCDGRLQRQEGALSVLVERLWPLPEEDTPLATLEVPSRDFR